MNFNLTNETIRSCGCTEGLMYCAECATEFEIKEYGYPENFPFVRFIINFNLENEEISEMFEKALKIEKDTLGKAGKLMNYHNIN